MNERHLRNVIRQMLFENEIGDYGAGGYGGSGLGYEDINFSPSGGGGSDYGSGPRGTLLKVFWAPFADVAKAARLTAQDILNVLRLTLTTAVRLSPVKLANARKKYEERKSKIDQQWAPILNSSYSAIANSDIGLVTLTFAPQLFFAAAIAKTAYTGPGAIARFFGQSGWLDFDLIPKSWKKSWKKTVESDDEWEKFVKQTKEKRSSSSESGSSSSISDRLKKFFFGESVSELTVSRDANIILEKNDKSDKSDKSRGRPPTPQDIEKFLRSHPAGQAITQALESANTELIAAKQELANDLFAEASSAVSRAKELIDGPLKSAFENAKNLDELDKSVSGITQGGETLKSVKKRIEDTKKTIADVEKKETEKIKNEFKTKAGDKEEERIEKDKKLKELIEDFKKANLPPEEKNMLSALDSIQNKDPEKRLDIICKIAAREAARSVADAQFNEMKGAFMRSIPQESVIKRYLESIASNVKKELVGNIPKDVYESPGSKEIRQIVNKTYADIVALTNKM